MAGGHINGYGLDLDEGDRVPIAVGEPMSRTSSKVVRCQRCRKRMRNMKGGIPFMSPAVVGHLCPDCQTPGEDLEAELNLVLHPPSEWREADLSNLEERERNIRQLIVQYSTPKIMRYEADLLAAPTRWI